MASPADTRERLLVAAERLFATAGVWQASSAEIVRQAGQRNTSAISYHFGSRSQLLTEILIRHGDPIDQRRGELLDAIDFDSVPALLDALLGSMVGCLDDERGRNYLLIVNQLSAMSMEPSVDPALRPPHLQRGLASLGAHIEHLDPLVRAERIKAMILLMTASLAAKVATVDDPDALDAATHATNLVDMLTGVILAPAPVPS